MLQKFRRLLLQKGQGVVEYALILGFVAVLAVYLITGSGLLGAAKSNIDNVKSVMDSSRL